MRIATLMDPLAAIKPYKDSSFAMLLAAQRRGHQLDYLDAASLGVHAGRVSAVARSVVVRDQIADYHTLGEPRLAALTDFDLVLMRKDPPFDAEYLADTQLLSLAQTDGAHIANDPQALRDCNEKLYACQFPDLTPPMLVSRDPAALRDFALEQGQAVVKPLAAMAGAGVFLAHASDPNLKVILETLTENGRRLTLIQRYLPQIVDGDKRILLIAGEPVPYLLARIPSADDFRGNLARGGRGVVRPLEGRDLELATTVGRDCKRRGLHFVGLDVIGDYVTEINVTSPTGIREIEKATALDVAGQLIDTLLERARK